MRPTSRLVLLLAAISFFCLVLPQDCPAPLIWHKGEGWRYERSGTTTANNPTDQLALAKKLREAKAYDDAATAYRRLIIRWPTAFAVQDARLGLGECLTSLGFLYKAHKEYQLLIDKHPNSPYFEVVLQRQFDIATRFMNGEKHRVWRIKLFSGLDKAVEIFEQIVKNGPYSKVGPDAQFRIGLTYEKMKDNINAVHAYEKILERYPKLPIAEDAQFQIGWAYKAEAQRAEYDQNNANQAIAAFTDFLTRFPTSKRVDEAKELRNVLKQEQSKGLFQIAAFYEKRQNYKAALIYYNEVIEQNPRSDWANQAQRKITALSPLAKQAEKPPAK